MDKTPWVKKEADNGAKRDFGLLAGPAGLVGKLVGLVEWVGVEIGLTHKLVGLVEWVEVESEFGLTHKLWGMVE
jgi:hypothetical protein